MEAMMSQEFLLSVEEFGLGLLLIGEMAMLRAWLETHGIEWKENVVRERFSAAAHSLVARNLARLGRAGSLILDESLGQTLQDAAHPDYSLSFARVMEGKEERWVFHVKEDRIVLQHVHRGAGYRLERMSFSLEVLHAKAAAFFRISPSFAVHECGELPLEEFERLSEATDLPASLRRELLEDREAEVFRGSLARIDYTEHGPVSDYGCLVLGGPQRTWLFRLLPVERRIRICPSSPEGLREELLLLMERRYR
jgi:hypothetical protein